jgi:hypothetical protein
MGYRSETSLQIQESKVAIIDRFFPRGGLPIFQGGCQYLFILALIEREWGLFPIGKEK